MITRELIDKINSLWHKQKTFGLTDEEKAEQRLAREQYLEGIRGQVRGMLESVRSPISPPDHEHNSECSCEECKH